MSNLENYISNLYLSNRPAYDQGSNKKMWLSLQNKVHIVKKQNKCLLTIEKN